MSGAVLNTRRTLALLLMSSRSGIHCLARVLADCCGTTPIDRVCDPAGVICCWFVVAGFGGAALDGSFVSSGVGEQLASSSVKEAAQIWNPVDRLYVAMRSSRAWLCMELTECSALGICRWGIMPYHTMDRHVRSSCLCWKVCSAILLSVGVMGAALRDSRRQGALAH